MIRFALPVLVASLASSACNSGPASTGTDSTVRVAPDVGCEAGEAPLAGTGLCQRDAAALLFPSGGPLPGAMEGCQWVIRDTAFATDMLLYRTLRCGKTETAVEFSFGNRESDLIYIRRAGGGTATDADGEPLVLARIFAGNPDGRARALWEARDDMQDAKAAGRCELKPPYQSEGLPGDALIVDVRREPADLERGDAVPECGPLGYNPAGGSIDFWRPHQGYAWFFSMGTDIWDVDPGSFTIIQKDGAGAWRRAAESS